MGCCCRCCGWVLLGWVLVDSLHGLVKTGDPDIDLANQRIAEERASLNEVQQQMSMFEVRSIHTHTHTHAHHANLYTNIYFSSPFFLKICLFNNNNNNNNKKKKITERYQ